MPLDWSFRNDTNITLSHCKIKFPVFNRSDIKCLLYIYKPCRLRLYGCLFWLHGCGRRNGCGRDSAFLIFLVFVLRHMTVSIFPSPQLRSAGSAFGSGKPRELRSPSWFLEEGGYRNALKWKGDFRETRTCETFDAAVGCCPDGSGGNEHLFS